MIVESLGSTCSFWEAAGDDAGTFWVLGADDGDILTLILWN